MGIEDWAGLPAVGTRVRVPYVRSTCEGEVISWHRLFGEPLARVQVQIPFGEEREIRFRSVSFSAEQFRNFIEIVDDGDVDSRQPAAGLSQGG